MKEIYLVQGKFMNMITLRLGNHVMGSIDFSSMNDVMNYFKHNPEGNDLRLRKNLNIILQVDNRDKRENLEEILHSIGFKKAFVSYELPYEKAKSRYVLNH
jgi:hypothetical protein